MLDDDNDITADGLLCLFCGHVERVEVHEVWGHDFMLDTCCEGLLDRLCSDMAENPTWAREFMRSLAIEELCGHRLRRVADGTNTLILDWHLGLVPTVTFRQARTFVQRHHEHCRAPVTWRFHQGICNGRTLLGVAVVGNPVAPGLNGRGIVEVNRLCLRRDLPDALRWNAASMLYGWCAREARRRGWQKIVTYTRADEPGTSLIAAGWRVDGRVRGRGWHSPRRARSNTNAWIDKVRWSRDLKRTDPAPEQRVRPHAATSIPFMEMVSNAFGPDFMA